MWMVSLLEIIVVIWPWLISTDSGLTLQEKIIPQFIIQNNSSKEWSKNETCLFTVIFMVIRERKIVSCMDVQKMVQKNSKFSLPLLEQIATHSHSKIAAFYYKKIGKGLQEYFFFVILDCFMERVWNYKLLHFRNIFLWFWHWQVLISAF